MRASQSYSRMEFPLVWGRVWGMVGDQFSEWFGE